MEYKEAIEWLFAQLPMFSRVGAAAYKPGLERSEALARHFGNPEKKFKSIHVAGTNGKGSVSNLIAATLQSQATRPRSTPRPTSLTSVSACASTGR